MTKVLLVTEAEWVVDAVTEALEEPGVNINTIDDGHTVRATVAADAPDAVIVDFQIGSMGGIAVCKDLRLESDMNRMARVPLLLLLDRRADEFLARHSDADAWLTKPLDAIRLRRAVDQLFGAPTPATP